MSRVNLVIHTQSWENYGAHDWDGQGECPQCWKAKGGDTYVYEFEFEDHTSVRYMMESITPLIESANDYAEEKVIDWTVEDVDTVAWDSWDKPYYLTKNFYGNYIATRELLFPEGVTESFVMGRQRERLEYHRTAA